MAVSEHNLVTERNSTTTSIWVLHGGDRELVVPASDRGLIVGRNQKADLVLEEPSVSAKHAEITPMNGRLYLRDLSSTNGTMLNAAPVDGIEQLRDGDQLHFGRLAFIVRRSQPSAHPAPPLPAEPEIADEPEIESGPTEVDQVCEPPNGLDQPEPADELGPTMESWFQPICQLPDCDTMGYEILLLAPSDSDVIPDAGDPFSVGCFSHAARVAGVRAAASEFTRRLFLKTHPEEPGTAALSESLLDLRDEFPYHALVLEVGATRDLNVVGRLCRLLDSLQIGLAYTNCDESLLHVDNLPLAAETYLKFSAPFVRQLERSSGRDRMHPLLIDVRSRGIRAIAEGVETAAQAETCIALGFDFAQGHLFGRPARSPQGS